MDSNSEARALKVEREAEKRSAKEKMYQDVYKTFRNCGFTRNTQVEVNKFWTTVKSLPLAELIEKCSSKMQAMEEKRKKGSITALFNKVKEKQVPSVNMELDSEVIALSTSAGPSSSTSPDLHDEISEAASIEVDSDGDTLFSQDLPKSRPTPAEDKTRKQLLVTEEKLNSLLRLRELEGTFTEEHLKQERELRKLEMGLKQTLTQLKKRREISRASRGKKGQELQQKGTVIRNVGRPRKEESYPDLPGKILELTSQGGVGAAHPRRRDEEVRTLLSTTGLHKQLINDGIEISRTALYNRFQPGNSRHRAAQAHKNSLPIRLLRATNDLHKSHDDWSFAKTSIDHVREFASVLGPEDVAILSQDDKCRVKLSLPAVDNQVKVLMHVDDKIKFPDHDFPVASSHKLIPSVYAALNIQPDMIGDKKAVSNNGNIKWMKCISQI